MNTPASSQAIVSIPKTKQRSIFGHKCGQHLMALGGLLLATATPALALSYVSGSLTDTNATSGNGVSSPAGAANIQYSDGSGTNGTNYGQIDIANDPADPAWVYDQGSAGAISSVTFWSDASSTSYSQLPSGTITIYGSSSPTGSWTQIGQVTRSMVRDTVLPNSQAIAGEAYRVPCNGSSYRYVRIKAVTPNSIGGLDNHWIIRRVEVNKNFVINHFHRTLNNSSVLNDLPRIPYNIVDGNTATMWNPQATDMVLTLDLGPTARRFQQIQFTPNSGDGAYLPQAGEVRVSSTDDPDNMDTVVGLFDISYNNINTDGATIILGQPFTKRFVQIHWTKVRNSALTETRIAEIYVDSVSDKPTGTDLTSLSIDPGYMIVPNSITYASQNVTNLNAALLNLKYVYLPIGTYYFDGSINMPTDSRLYGNSDDTTILTFTSTDAKIHVDGSDSVRLDHFQFNRTVDNASEAAILVERSGTDAQSWDVPYYTEIDNVKVVNNRSRSGAISLSNAVTAGVTNCSIYGSQRTATDYNGGGTAYNYIYGSGIQLGNSQNVYVNKNHIEEQRNMVDPTIYPQTNRPPNHDVIQAGGIEPASAINCVISDNYVRRYGVAIDINGATNCLVISNTTTENNNSGVKMCNATNNCMVISNKLDKCGIVGVWLAPGNGSGNVQLNLVQSNTISNAGQGLDTTGTNWTGSRYMAGDHAPAGIRLDDASSPATRVQNNTVTGNLVSGTSAIKTPVSTFGIFIGFGDDGPYPPYPNTVTGNTITP